MQIQRKSRWHSRRGTVTVEMALILPFIFTIIFGCLEFSRMNMIRNTSKNAAYKAARVGVVPGAQVANVTATAQNLMQVIGVNNATITVSPNPITDDSTSVTVTVSAPMNGNMFFTPIFVRNKIVTNTCTLNREDY